MNKNELFNYIELGRNYGVRVVVRVMPDYPGYVRVVGFHRKNRVIVEFYASGHNDAAFEFIGKFPTLELAINSVENYLEVPIDKWHNFNKTNDLVVFADNQNLELTFTESHRNLVKDFLSQKIKFPSGVIFKSKHQIWNSIEEYDESMKSLKTN